MRLISVVTPCYNEEENVVPLYHAIKKVFEGLPDYEYEHLYIDNCSTDKTPQLLEELARQDRQVKVILNSRNFGHIRSPFHGIISAGGDAVICMASDFQDPPDMIPLFIEKWNEGYKSVLAVKKKSRENGLMFLIRKMYYRLSNSISEVRLIENATGFGLFDRCVVDAMREMKDPYPYMRGMICEIGYDIALVEFTQPRRERGITKNNFYTLYDIAMLGITSNSRVPIRIAAMAGFVLSVLSILVSIVYLVLKLIFWDRFNAGQAPILVGLFFFGAVQLFFIGIIGEYVGQIMTRVTNRPLVIEKKRINFDQKQ
jgi:glycosyltransferase involved in cell wall biosynthesis